MPLFCLRSTQLLALLSPSVTAALRATAENLPEWFSWYDYDLRNQLNVGTNLAFGDLDTVDAAWTNYSVRGMLDLSAASFCQPDSQICECSPTVLLNRRDNEFQFWGET